MAQLKTIAAVLSESAVPDARGLFHIVAVEPVFWETKAGAQMTPTMTVIAEDDEQEPFAADGSVIVFRLVATAPDNDVVHLLEFPITVEPRTDDSLPRRFQIAAPLPFSPTRSGLYKFSVTATAASGVQQVWDRELHVRVT